ncbi:MAG: hypothetical protein D6760_11450 [Deltaproteobacteria bacterium]|nr:MAG: hypothetical protein D6760_11450 [Deltaproteobacteria bacterium]
MGLQRRHRKDGDVTPAASGETSSFDDRRRGHLYSGEPMEQSQTRSPAGWRIAACGAGIALAACIALAGASLVGATLPPCWQPVLGRLNLSPDSVGSGSLAGKDGFGSAVAAIGDLDGDGNLDLAVGAPGDDGGGSDRGAVWIVFLGSDGSIKQVAKVGDGSGGFSGTLLDGDQFGAALARLGDVDGDGVPDLAVGAPGDDDGGDDRGAVWILLLESDGTVKATSKISTLGSEQVLALSDGDAFGFAVAQIGDLDGDSIAELAVGAPGDDDGSFARGAVWVLFLDSDRSLRGARKLSALTGGLTTGMEHRGWFGRSVSALGDFDHDGVVDIVVGAPGDGTSFAPRGSAYLLMLESDGTVKSAHRIDSTVGILSMLIDDGDRFGMAVAALGDRNGDGTTDVAVGAPGDDYPYSGPEHVDRGAFWILGLAADGGVVDADRFPGLFGDADLSGSALAVLGDIDGNAMVDVAVGAPGKWWSLGDAWIELLNGPSSPTAACGDPSGDGRVTAADALRALRAAVGANFCDVFFCDVDRDGKVTATDAARILSKAVGIATLLACPQCTTTTSTTLSSDECFDDTDCGPGWVCLAFNCFPATTTTLPAGP